jgi:hypothetical protein
VTCRELECVGVRESRLLAATFSPLLVLFLGPPCLPCLLPVALLPLSTLLHLPQPPSLSSLLCCIHGSLSSLYPSLLTPTRDRTDRIDAHIHTETKDPKSLPKFFLPSSSTTTLPCKTISGPCPKILSLSLSLSLSLYS